MLDRYPQCKPRALNGEAVYSRPAAGPPGVRQNNGGQSVERAPAERGIKWRVACHVKAQVPGIMTDQRPAGGRRGVHDFRAITHSENTVPPAGASDPLALVLARSDPSVVGPEDGRDRSTHATRYVPGYRIHRPRHLLQ